MCSVSNLLQELTKLILGMKRKRGRYFECRLVQGPNIMSLGDLNWWLFCHITHFNNNMQEMNKKRLIKAFEYTTTYVHTKLVRNEKKYFVRMWWANKKGRGTQSVCLRPNSTASLTDLLWHNGWLIH